MGILQAMKYKLGTISVFIHHWLRICSTCYKHFPVLSSFTSYHRVCN